MCSILYVRPSIYSQQNASVITSVCCFFKIQNYIVTLKQKEGGMKMFNLKVYLVKVKLGKALSIAGAG